MNSFELYFQLGWKHILDPQGFDHILFVLALSAIYVFKDWKKILILITAFTIGHSLTLALATFQILNVKADVIEFLIPCTIAITALVTILQPKPSNGRGVQLNYIFALFFGLVHGMGFSLYLRQLLGKEVSIFEPLLAFNIGLEVGQLVIVTVFLVLTFILTGVAGVNRKEWTLVISSIILGMSLMLLLELKFW